MLTTRDHFLSFMCLEMFAKSIFSITFPGTDVMPSGLLFPRSSFFKIGVTFILFQVSETYPNCCNLLKVTKNVFAMASVSFLSIHGCSPPGPTDLLMSSLFKCSLGWSSSTDGKYSLLQTFHLVSGAWAFWRSVLAVTNETKKTKVPWSFLCCSSSVPYPIQQWPHVFPSLPMGSLPWKLQAHQQQLQRIRILITL